MDGPICLTKIYQKNFIKLKELGLSATPSTLDSRLLTYLLTPSPNQRTCQDPTDNQEGNLFLKAHLHSAKANQKAAT